MKFDKKFYITWQTSNEVYNNLLKKWEQRIHNTMSEFWAESLEHAYTQAEQWARSTMHNGERNFPNKFRNAKFIKIVKGVCV